MNRIDIRPTTSAAPRTGSIAWCNVMNPHENPNCGGKLRPVVLVARVWGHWVGMGLTTNPTYRDGRGRISVPNPAKLGLRRSGYLWGDRLTHISAIDVHDVIGTCDHDLAEADIALARLVGAWAEGLRREAA